MATLDMPLVALGLTRRFLARELALIALELTKGDRTNRGPSSRPTAQHRARLLRPRVVAVSVRSSGRLERRAGEARHGGLRVRPVRP